MSGSIALDDLSILTHTVWDAIVIGAGPAGALAARQMAVRGLRTLVVDAKRFPRPKVCGGCLNRRGIAALEAAGLSHLLEGSTATRVESLHWIVGQQHARLALPEMHVVDRAPFDAELIHAAMGSGATFVDGVQAGVEPRSTGDVRYVTLARQADRAKVAARVVVVADGLARSSLKRLRQFRPLASADSRIGVGATLPYSTRLPRDEITMIVGRHGYVGLAACGDDRFNVAAALDPAATAQSTVSELIAAMIRAAGIELAADWPAVGWHGTPPLTSRPSRVADERLFVIGDASGYVEPFSGEGMATAFHSALAVVPLAAATAAQGWRPQLAAEWERLHRAVVVDRQTTCRQLAWMLRQPWATAAAIGLCRAQPWVARRFIRKVS